MLFGGHRVNYFPPPSMGYSRVGGLPEQRPAQLAERKGLAPARTVQPETDEPTGAWRLSPAASDDPSEADAADDPAGLFRDIEGNASAPLSRRERKRRKHRLAQAYKPPTAAAVLGARLVVRLGRVGERFDLQASPQPPSAKGQAAAQHPWLHAYAERCAAAGLCAPRLCAAALEFEHPRLGRSVELA